MTKIGGLTVFLLSLILLSACTSQEELALARLQEVARQTEMEVTRLGEHIDKGHIANTRKLKQYGQIVKSQVAGQSPELVALVDSLMLDATSKGPIYTGLKARLADAKSDMGRVKGFAAMEGVEREFALISEASSMTNYGWMLTDPINVLADMSQGKLARVEAMSKKASLRANKAEDYGAGSQLVGNPGYGYWGTNASGQSFWHWYGQYAFFSTLFHRPIYYDSWSSRRDYSYYHEAGRYHYTSKKQRQAQQKMEQQTKRKFQKSGKSFKSPYAKSKTGSNRATMQASKATRSFSSAYAGGSKSRSSSYSSVNSRSSSSRTTRSFGGGGK